MKARVEVTLKSGVLDPQGEAVRHALGALGFEGVGEVRVGKVIEVDLAAHRSGGGEGRGRGDVPEAPRQHGDRELRGGDRMSVRAGVVVFPGSNCDRDIAVALAGAGAAVAMVWHKETALPAGLDLVAIPGGFSFGDYLRCGAIAARSPIMGAVADFARAGGHVIGVCNGFQVLIEAGLLPGALMRNAGLRFVCGTAPLVVGTSESAFTAGYRAGETIRLPIAHHDGNYFADEATLDRLEGEDRVAFRYAENPNGSARDIAGILSAEPAGARADAAPGAGGRSGCTAAPTGGALFSGFDAALAAGLLQSA